MIALKINVQKISRDDMFKGEKGTYLDLLLMTRPDEYGNDGYVVQGVSKEKRQSGEKGPIVGNWKELTPPKPKPVAPRIVKEQSEDDIPW